MSATVLTDTGTRSRPTTTPGRPDAAVALRAFKQVWKSAALWALVFGGTAASSALTYVSTYPTLASRQQVAATTGRDVGFAVLLGPVSAIGDVGGYTVYKGFVFLTTIGAIWALLATTRLLRGEEDVGRWQMVLAGATRAPRATAATLVAMGGAVAIIFGGTTAIMLLTARTPDLAFGFGETVLYGVSLAVAPAVFVGVGAVTAQLGRTRRLASELGMGVFGVAFVVRMIADSGNGTHWLRWLTPFGWIEQMRPFTANDLWPLLPATATIVGLVGAAAILAGRRDVGGGVLAARDAAPVRAFGLGSPFGLVARLELPVLVAWCVGATVTAFAFGIIAKVATGAVPSSLRDNLDKFGVQGSFLHQYIGVAFLLVAAVIALIPASPIGAASEEEASGRLVHVVVGPTDRTALLRGRLVLGGAGIVATSLLAGLATWAGAQTQGIDIGLVTMLRSGLNLAPTALAVLGIGAVAVALAPGAAVRTVYTIVAGSFVIDLLSSLVDGARWLEHLSLFHYMALAPAQDLDARTIAITVAAALALCTIATIIFSRRDVQTG